jgi:16S rRNA (guanine(966)-N(2))-methyltransferase RsmD
MRIVAGTARGTRLDCPPGEKVRPTPEMARQAIFNILRDAVEGATALDLFAGVGTIGIEALSRGAAWCVFVERSARHLRFLERNLQRAHLAGRADLLLRDVFRCAGSLAGLGRPADIAFVGPPFPLLADPAGRAALMALLDEFAERRLLKPGCVVILQHDRRDPIPESTPRLGAAGRRSYGRNALTLYKFRE